MAEDHAWQLFYHTECFCSRGQLAPKSDSFSRTLVLSQLGISLPETNWPHYSSVIHSQDYSTISATIDYFSV